MKILRKLVDEYNGQSLPAKSGLWFLGCSFTLKGIAALTTPIFTRILTESEYGQVSVFYSWQDILALFITLGLSSSVYQRGLVQHEKEQDTFTGIMLTLTCVSTCFAYFSYMVFHKIIHFLTGLSALFIGILFLYTFIGTVLDFWYQKKRVKYQYIPFVLVTLILAFTKPAVSITAIHFFPDDPVLARILSDTAVTAIIGIPLFFHMMWRSKRYFDKRIWAESLMFVLPLIPHFLSQRVLSQSDRIMISHMSGDAQAGIYSLAYSVGMLLMLLNSALDGTVAPWIYRNLRDKHYDRIRIHIQPLILLFAMCVLDFILIAPEIVRLFAPAEYHGAIYMIPAVAVSSYFIFLYSQFVYFEYYIGKTQFIPFATIISAIINLVLNMVFIRKYGYIAAAYTTLICYIIYTLCHYMTMRYLCSRYLHIRQMYETRFLTLVSIGIIFLAHLAILLYKSNIIRWMLVTGAAGITISYAYWILKQFGGKTYDR